MTGNSDYSALGASYNRAPGNSSEILALLDSPRLLRWFAQNPGHVHHKLEALPIGLENSHFGRLGSPGVMADVLLPQVRIHHCDDDDGYNDVYDASDDDVGWHLPAWGEHHEEHPLLHQHGIQK